jgi:IS30 family transposase
MKKHRITKEEREEISRMLSQNKSITYIANKLGRHKSSISREVSRNGINRKTYRAYSAQRIADKSKSRSGRQKKLNINNELKSVVIQWLKHNWSPVQIMERLKIEYPNDPTMRISHETIYRYLYIKPRSELVKHLRRQHKFRRKRKDKNKQETRGKIPDMVSIDDRPKEVNGRVVPGHWEGDLILGKEKKSAMGTLSERSTRFTILVKITDRKYTAESVRKAFTEAFKKLPKELKKTLTYDQGREMKEHKLFTEETQIQVYFAHVRSPWERGTNENTNSLVRQYFPSNIDLTEIADKEIQRVQAELNDRPRKCLDFKKPNEVFFELLQS